jgi:urocanate hydratase
MVLEGYKKASKHLESMRLWDVNNEISRRSWARNNGVLFGVKRA